MYGGYADLSSRWLEQVVFDDSGNAWVCSYGDGIVKFDGTVQQRLLTSDSLVNNLVYSFYEDEQGVWIGTGEGICLYDSGSWTWFTDTLAPTSWIFDLTLDSAGNYWGVGPHGAYMYDGSDWSYYTQDSGLAMNTSEAVVCDTGGNVWVGSRSNGVSVFNGTNWTYYDTSNGLSNNRINDMGLDGSGNVWVCTDSGACKYDGIAWTVYDTSSGLDGNLVTCMTVDDGGRLWFGTAWDGVSMLDNTVWTSFPAGFPHDQALISGQILSIAADTGNVIWVGTYAGVSMYNGTSWYHYNTDDGLILDQVTCIHVDQSGKRWFGCDGGIVTMEGQDPLNLTHTQTRFKNNTIELYPNPFSNNIAVSLLLQNAKCKNQNLSRARTRDAKLEIFDISGRQLYSSNVARRASFVWNGCNKRGIHMSSGIYLVKVKAGGQVLHRKIVKVE
jgi:ligand-binding sensor domain-containing protein